MNQDFTEFKNKQIQHINEQYTKIKRLYDKKTISDEEAKELISNLKVQLEILDISENMDEKIKLYNIINIFIQSLKVISVLK
jgi:hypothetical protein